MSVLLIMAAFTTHVDRATAQTQTTEVDIKLLTGGAISGLVVDHNEDAVVVVRESTPYVFAWSEMESGSAYAVRRDIMVLERRHGDQDQDRSRNRTRNRDGLSAQDYLELGRFAISLHRRDLASSVFHKATKLDPSLATTTRTLLRETATAEASPAISTPDIFVAATAKHPPVDSSAVSGALADVTASLPADMAAAPPAVASLNPIQPLTAEARSVVMTTYREFGVAVATAVYDKLHLIETQHFLIWTDFEVRHRPLLAEWCEAMYANVAEDLGLDPDANVFLAKCPIFCWRSPSRFRKFAQVVDGYDARNAAGYTRSIPANGHVHVAVLRMGHDASAMERFAATLVHEGTHAFVHRLYTPAPIPQWVGEGFAELVTRRVLGDVCPVAEKSALLCAQYARYDWPIINLIEGVGPIGIHQYPLAYSLVLDLESRGRTRFAGFMRALKDGASVPTALAGSYDGLTVVDWQSQWRASHDSGVSGG